MKKFKIFEIWAFKTLETEFPSGLDMAANLGIFSVDLDGCP